MNIKQVDYITDEMMKLLLIADPNKQFVQTYCENGIVYSAMNERVLIGLFVLQAIDCSSIEIMNISVAVAFQKKGFGKMLIQEAIHLAKSKGYKEIIVRTGNSSIDQLAFYLKKGFLIEAIEKNYFIQHYPQPIYENGIQCVNQIILKLSLNNETLLR